MFFGIAIQMDKIPKGDSSQMHSSHHSRRVEERRRVGRGEILTGQPLLVKSNCRRNEPTEQKCLYGFPTHQEQDLHPVLQIFWPKRGGSRERPECALVLGTYPGLLQ